MAYTEVKGTEIVKFQSIGDKLEGKLWGIENVTLTDEQTKKEKRVTAYLIRRGDGTMVKILPSYDLGDKLRNLPARIPVYIAYEKDMPPTKQGQSPMKVFKVLADFGAVPDLDASLHITDDDIPF